VAGGTQDLILEHNPRWFKAGWPGIHPEQVRVLDRAGFTGVEGFSHVVDVPSSPRGLAGPDTSL